MSMTWICRSGADSFERMKTRRIVSLQLVIFASNCFVFVCFLFALLLSLLKFRIKRLQIEFKSKLHIQGPANEVWNSKPQNLNVESATQAQTPFQNFLGVKQRQQRRDSEWFFLIYLFFYQLYYIYLEFTIHEWMVIEWNASERQIKYDALFLPGGSGSNGINSVTNSLSVGVLISICHELVMVSL